MNYHDSLAFAQKMDQQDPLTSYRKKFLIPKTARGDDVLYFCGNSLGLQPTMTRTLVNEELEKWEKYGVDGHTHASNPWVAYHELVADSLARLVGATPQEVVAMNSLTVNLHLMMVTFYRPTKKRHKILMEGGAFPSDHYAVTSQIRYHGYNPASSLIELFPSGDAQTIKTEEILDVVERHGDEIALIMLG